MLLAPMFAAIAVAIKLGDGGPVFFSQTRVGQFGRPFRLHKFRTMVPQAEQQGLQLTLGGDVRITRVGRWLRRTKLDELPQLWNVAKGEMSVVGPRPEVPRYVAFYTPEQRRVLEVRPGLTDPASLKFIDESSVLATAASPEATYIQVILPMKLAINLDYLRRRTLASDMLVIVSTVWRLLVRATPTEVAVKEITSIEKQQAA
jgi:lipopolysaccharide/colanic/teichoic acid biosynthesis glycosyltransferase